jgi:hypothetical protein
MVVENRYAMLYIKEEAFSVVYTNGVKEKGKQTRTMAK